MLIPKYQPKSMQLLKKFLENATLFEKKYHDSLKIPMEISLIGILGNVIGKAKSICILLFLTVISSFAQSYLQLPQEGYYETKAEAELYLDAFRNECISVKDVGGGSFSGTKKLVDDTGDLFHQKYGTGGYAKTYKCPED